MLTQRQESERRDDPARTSSITLSLLWKKHFSDDFSVSFILLFLFLWTIKFEGLYTSADKGDTNDRSTHAEDDTRLASSLGASPLPPSRSSRGPLSALLWGRSDSASLSMLCGRGRGQKHWNFLFLHWFSSVSVTGWCYSCCKESFDPKVAVGVWNDGSQLNKMMVKM